MLGMKNIAVGAGLAGLALTTLPAASADAYVGQTASRSGDCTQAATYMQTLRDVDNNPQTMRVWFKVANAHSGSGWTFRVYKNGNLVERIFKHADDSGYVSIDDTVAAYSHSSIQVKAHARYGESCKSAFRLTS